MNHTELRDLCFDLAIDYESLPAIGKSAKARELAAHCQRHKRYQELEDRCLKLRAGAPPVSAAPTKETPQSWYLAHPYGKPQESRSTDFSSR